MGQVAQEEAAAKAYVSGAHAEQEESALSPALACPAGQFTQPQATMCWPEPQEEMGLVQVSQSLASSDPVAVFVVQQNGQALHALRPVASA